MAARHIVCFGNDLHGDDGFGVRVYERLSRLAWPADVGVFNAGIAGLDALRFLEGCDRAILVDALADAGNIGEVRVLRRADLAAADPPRNGHDPGIPYLLAALEVIRDPPPDILVVGVEVGAIAPFSPGLSAATERAVSTAIRLIRGLLSN
jgi:hydrogenase maturation protease